jgi:quercetin dioxygenase-like cupin family protein
MAQPLMISPDQRAAPLAAFGEKLTVLASSAQTGSYEIFCHAGPAGSGPPPHHHPWDEAMFVIEGEVAVMVGGGGEQVATAGTLLHIPAGTTHCFRIVEGGAVMLSVTSRSGASAFFTAVAAQVSPTEPDLTALVTIASAHGVRIAMAAGLAGSPE